MGERESCRRGGNYLSSSPTRLTFFQVSQGPCRGNYGPKCFQTCALRVQLSEGTKHVGPQRLQGIVWGLPQVSKKLNNTSVGSIKVSILVELTTQQLLYLRILRRQWCLHFFLRRHLDRLKLSDTGLLRRRPRLRQR